jgi:hypothetical protein
MMDSLSGNEELHSSILVLDDRDREVDRRIWTAEIGVLFPFVEERRRDLLRTFGHLLQVPFTGRNGDTIEDIRDLEIGHIESQLQRSAQPVGTDTLRLLRLLRESGNSLSNLEPLEKDLLRWDELSVPILKLL